jgi:hypothetical protein
MNGVDKYLNRETAWAVTGFIPGVGLIAGLIFEAPVAAIAKRSLKKIPDASQTDYFEEKLKNVTNKQTKELSLDEIKKLNNFSHDMFFDKEKIFMDVEQNPGLTPFGYIRCLARNFISYMNREATGDSHEKKFAKDRKVNEEVGKEGEVKVERDVEGYISYYKIQCLGYIDSLPLSSETKIERNEIIKIFCSQLQTSVDQIQKSSLSKEDLNIALLHTYQSLKYNMRKNLYNQHIFKGLLVRPTIAVGQTIYSIYHAVKPTPPYKTLM